MKLHAARYGVTAMMCVLAVCSMSIATQTIEAKWLIAIVGSLFSGMLCCVVIPIDQQGD